MMNGLVCNVFERNERFPLQFPVAQGILIKEHDLFIEQYKTQRYWHIWLMTFLNAILISISGYTHSITNNPKSINNNSNVMPNDDRYSVECRVFIYDIVRSWHHSVLCPKLNNVTIWRNMNTAELKRYSGDFFLKWFPTVIDLWDRTAVCVNVVRFRNGSNWPCDSSPYLLCRGRNYLTSGFYSSATSPEMQLTKAAH